VKSRIVSVAPPIAPRDNALCQQAKVSLTRNQRRKGKPRIKPRVFVFGAFLFFFDFCAPVTLGRGPQSSDMPPGLAGYTSGEAFPGPG